MKLYIFVFTVQRHFFCRSTCNTSPQTASIWVAFVSSRETWIFKAWLPHERRRFILFVFSARQIQGGEGISHSSRERDSFCDFIIDLPIYVTPCSGGSTFVLFVLSLFQTRCLCSTEEGQMDWSAMREKTGNAMQSPTAVRGKYLFLPWIEDDKDVSRLLRNGNFSDTNALTHSVQHTAFTLQLVHIQIHSRGLC